jgi:hypothetical protein
VCLFAKRLEDGKFRRLNVQDGVIRLSAAQLSACRIKCRHKLISDSEITHLDHHIERWAQDIAYADSTGCGRELVSTSIA